MALCAAFDWADLPEDALVVDVGGGIGTVSIELAKAFPKLKLLVQDRSKVIEDGKKVVFKSIPL